MAEISSLLSVMFCKDCGIISNEAQIFVLFFLAVIFHFPSNFYKMGFANSKCESATLDLMLITRGNWFLNADQLKHLHNNKEYEYLSMC